MDWEENQLEVASDWQSESANNAISLEDTPQIAAQQVSTETVPLHPLDDRGSNEPHLGDQQIKVDRPLESRDDQLFVEEHQREALNWEENAQSQDLDESETYHCDVPLKLNNIQPSNISNDSQDPSPQDPEGFTILNRAIKILGERPHAIEEYSSLSDGEKEEWYERGFQRWGIWILRKALERVARPSPPPPPSFT